ncbi:TonB-dependent receptor [Hymenobacter sp. BT175]|uniref:TonB-dependent receptor domain-containing protein n=1 Tax=Hymenobacter translucens TaxID=2886507 RepID=UPI001D0ED538|nr:TonB-dependent receptor [Hymenobacter translucens]MCC2545202.1 TonB-dependent receptor [Hymenobacter translucens]
MNHFFSFSRSLRSFGLLVALVTLAASAQAQAPTTGSVTGSLLDQSNGQALPFANVVLLRAQDSSFVSGAQTGENGAFVLDKVSLGTYLVRASVVGYKPLRRTVSLTAAAPQVQLGALRLGATATQLKGVTVQGEKAAIVDNLDKKVINVEKDLGSVGGTAVNVLQNVPSVTVDQNGAVSMRGTSNITILIDGKPTGGAGQGNRLEQIPASSIERVEVMTNPSARYDAQGGGGVLNIILKKQKKDGWNGTAMLNVGTRDKYNTSLSLNRRAGKLNVSGSYDAVNDQWHNRSNQQQQATLEGSTLVTDLQGRSTNHNKNHNGRLALDYTLSPTQSVSVSVAPNLHHGDNSASQTTSLRKDDQSLPTQTSATAVTEDVNILNSRLDYRRTWEGQKGRELSGSINHTLIDADVNVGQRLLGGAPVLTAWRQDFAVQANVVDGQIDYVYPLAGKGRVDLGIKSQYQTSNGTNDYMQETADKAGYVFMPERSFAYTFNEYVQAGYGTYQREFGKWSVQGGLRAEYTHTYGEVLNRQGKFDRQYLNLFPSTTVVRTLPGDQRVQVSYARRINRPDFMQLLPFPLYQDARNYRIGDPNIRPEYVNSLELGHQVSKGGATLSTTVFYRQINNAIQRFRDVDTVATRQNPGLGIVSMMYNRNLGQSTSYGVEMSLNQPLAKWWRLTATGSLFQNSITAATGTEASRRNVTGTVRLLNTFNPTPKLDVQLTGSYRAPVLTVQGRLESIYGVDVAFRQRLFNDKAALTLRVSDIFNTRRQRISAYSNGYQTTGEFKNETQLAYLGFSYYFGSNKPPKRIEAQPQGGGGGFGG